MSYMFAMGECVSCGSVITFNPNRVPSLLVNGSREPLCRGCFGEWNQYHRTSKGLEPLKLEPNAYGPEPVECDGQA